MKKILKQAFSILHKDFNKRNLIKKYLKMIRKKLRRSINNVLLYREKTREVKLTQKLMKSDYSEKLDNQKETLTLLNRLIMKLLTYEIISKYI